MVWSYAVDSFMQIICYVRVLWPYNDIFQNLIFLNLINLLVFIKLTFRGFAPSTTKWHAWVLALLYWLSAAIQWAISLILLLWLYWMMFISARVLFLLDWTKLYLALSLQCFLFKFRFYITRYYWVFLIVVCDSSVFRWFLLVEIDLR